MRMRMQYPKAWVKQKLESFRDGYNEDAIVMIAAITRMKR
jgi:hypothetical protein